MPFVKGQSGNPSGVRSKAQLDENGDVTAKWVIARANDARRKAMRENQISAAIAALRLISDIKGFSRAKEAEDIDALKRGTDAPPAETLDQYYARQRRMGVEATTRPANGSDKSDVVQ